MGKQTSGFSLPGFVRIAPSIYVQDAQLNANAYHSTGYEPFSHSSLCLPPGPAAKLSSRSRETAPPDLIIITSWTGAAAKHVAKYTAAYNTLYPGVPLLVITTAVSDLVLHSETHKLQALAPAVDYLVSQEEERPPYSHSHYCPPRSPRFPSLLLHAFSEGGAHKAVLLARAYCLSHQNKKKIPLRALILDSTPGRASYTRATAAFAQAMPPFWSSSPVLNALKTPFAAGVVGLVWAGLQGDGVVWWGDVHAHGVESATIGIGNGNGGGGGGKGGVGSLMVRFKRTEHCAHAKGVVNGEVYWAAVRKTWETTEDGGMGLRMGLGRRLSLDSLCWDGDRDGGGDAGGDVEYTNDADAQASLSKGCDKW
ncbi:hypothetical protein C8A00DRAFT_13329 [Chaetomidium leptoderma]|uniref:Uncharacterized protein n=1 Tax=Chaetomidium leptoderma TaxID=669021 RepID=A0AAN6VSV2_9PEZI|nr:hypothetical protein C8A00DRAFT_13329 [Chaetomidium leptoderma]